MTRSMALLFCAACLVFARPAAARPRVALTKIAGDAGGGVRDAVAEALDGDELSLIGGREVNRAVKKLGDVAALTDDDFKTLAAELAADAIVSGRLGKTGRTRTLKLRVFVGKKRAQGFTISFNDPRSERFRALLHDTMLTKLGAASDGASARTSKGDGEDEVKPARKARAGSDDEAAARPARKARARSDDEDAVARPVKRAKVRSDDEDAVARPVKRAKVRSDDEDDTARPARKATTDETEPEPGSVDDEVAPDSKVAVGFAAEDAERRRAKSRLVAVNDDDGVAAVAAVSAVPSRGADQRAVWVAIGPAVVQHSIQFVTTDFANKPRNVALSPAAGGRADGEFYPLALLNRRGVVAGLGLGFEYEQEADATVTVPTATMTATVPVKQYYYSIGLRLRFALGSTETSPTLTLRGGYAQRVFAADPRQLTDLAAIQAVVRDTPPIIYTMFDPGVTLRVPVTRGLSFMVGGRAMIITDAGPIVTSNLYGQSLVYGAAGSAGVDVRIGSRFELRFAGEFVQVAFSFKGGGALSNQLDGNPATQDVAGLTERSIGGSATFAVLY